MSRRLVITVEIADDDPGASDTAREAAEAVLDGAQPHELVSAAWERPRGVLDVIGGMNVHVAPPPPQVIVVPVEGRQGMRW